MHHFEDVFVLECDIKFHVFGDFVELGLDFFHVDGRVGDVDGHGHDEVLGHDALADVDDVDVGFGHGVGDARDDADPVGARDGDDADLGDPFFAFLAGHIAFPFRRRLVFAYGPSL